jgi:DNA-binding winged helix-turn-helix (wHTH) protein
LNIPVNSSQVSAAREAVWPDVAVSENLPANSVNEIRKALGDEAQAPRFIETVQRRGYRFVAPVHFSKEP